VKPQFEVEGAAQLLAFFHLSSPETPRIPESSAVLPTRRGFAFWVVSPELKKRPERKSTEPS
jgi:hypothetical protein